MARYVRFDTFGGPEVLHLVTEEEPPTVGAGQVRVRVYSAGLNPVDWKIFTGPAAAAYNGVPPCGNGNDFAGVVDEVGAGVTAIQAGDAVFGGKRMFAQADYVVIDAGLVTRMPKGLDFDVAGSLDIVGRTAWATVREAHLTADDTVLVTAAAGGVGVLAAQLARLTGATVIGTASRDNHEFLRGLGVIPVEYGDGLVERVRALAPRVTAALDNHGTASVDAALELGVPGARVNSIATHGYRADAGVTTVGGGKGTREELAELARLLADGEIVLPIDSVYPIERVREAYERLMHGHLRGKIVLATL